MSDFVDPYTKFAYAYDVMMENVDYVRWAEYIDDLFALYNYRPKRVLNIACGTGSIDILLAQKGYEMFGIDLAFEMLALAKRKADRRGIKLNLWQQDMRELTVSKPFDAILCLYDSINYMTTEEDLKKVFIKVSEALVPRGLFIFDVTTERNIIEHFHLKTFAENNKDFSYIWKNLYIPRDKLCKTILTFFLKEGDCYKKYDEYHIQKIFSVDQVKNLLSEAEFKLLSSYDAFTFNKCGRSSDRINFTAVKKV
ncbi:MAG: class I SAM-dependent DNA methyltransferase [Candidatus Poribacteria bacterium]